MPAPTRLIVLGNCQAQLMETLLAAGLGEAVALDCLQPVFLLEEEARAEIERKLDDAAVIFAQRTAADYHVEWLRTSALRERYGSKLLAWPNVYFDGYFPDVRYVYLERWGKLQGPLDDYHLGGVIASYTGGASVTEAARTAEEASFDEDPFAASLARLAQREADVDVRISDFVGAVAGERRAFYTPNHPYNFVLIEMCRRLAEAAGLGFAAEKAAAVETKLDRIYIPTYPSIRRNRNLPFDRVPLYRGLEVGPIRDFAVGLGVPRSMPLRELVASYFRIYDQAFGTSVAA